MNPWIKMLFSATVATLVVCEGNASIEVLDLDIVSYEDFINEDRTALDALQHALYEKGIVGIKGIPGYKEKVLKFIETARAFSALPEEVKESYAPNRALGETFLGYEKGKEKFKRPDGRWVIDDLKVSYYGFVPDSAFNKWPKEMDLRTPFQDIGKLMSEMGEAVMQKIGLIGPKAVTSLDGAPRLGRMLYYRKSEDSSKDNPYWCGSHFDHGLFTALLPAFYFAQGEAVPEPEEAGLFVKTTSEGIFKKVVANDPEVLLFQVGEFGQLVTHDAIRATEHRVHKAEGRVERFTMALFTDAPMDMEVRSTSVLTADSRYGGKAGDPCTYRHWNGESFKRYLVKDDDVK